MKQIILASASPRRKEILEKTGLPFTIEESDYREDMTLALSPQDLAKHLSLGKAQKVAERYKNVDTVIIAADTFVVYEKRILGKPTSENDAREMLQLLQGKSHTIITGVAIIDTTTNTTESFFDEAKVYLKSLTTSEINAYIATGEPMDKAGAYAVQELGAVFVEKIEGDFFGVMGLPLVKVVEVLKTMDIRVL